MKIQKLKTDITCYKVAAFTLAEVLITLAIIGVVAALTIPNLIQSHNEKAWATAKSVFEKRLEVATKQMNTEEKLAGYTNTMDFVNELKKYIKITRICDNTEITKCFNKKVIWNESDEPVEISTIKKARDLGQNDWGTTTVAVQFADGVNAIIAYNPKIEQEPYNNQFVATKESMAILYDVSGFKKPNSAGKDIGAINVNSLKHVCTFEYNSLCLGLPFYPEPVSKEECQEMFESGKYGMELACRGTDYWAGAVKACGGTQNMPTFNEYYSFKKSSSNKTQFNKFLSSIEGTSYSTVIWVSDSYDYDYYGNCGLLLDHKGSYSCYHSNSAAVAVCKE